MRLGTGLARGTIRVPVLRSAQLRPATDGPGRRLSGQLASFILIGVASTVAYVLVYLLLRSVVAAQAANAVSLLLTAVANTAVNRRVTFGIRGRTHAARHQVRGLIAFAIGLVLTSGALAALHASAPQAGRTAELTVLVAANLTATLVRFGLYRSWVFRGPRPGLPPGTSAPDRPATVPDTALSVSRPGARPDFADGDFADRDLADGDFR
ncbi:MAG: GtrA family protein [Streptosporangiaceae bacterium]